MKVKEMPKSIYHSLRLSLTSAEKLKKGRPELPIIVSLASIPSRLHIVHYTIKSLLVQRQKPKEIVLWLHKDLKSKIPKKLANLIGNIFEIRYSELTCSHRKLVNTLKQYPDQIIVTCDDDMIYPEDWLYNLYKAHLEEKSVVIANQTRCISYDKKGNLLAYTKWKGSNGCNPKAILPIGAGGTLYPPNSLHDDVLNPELFLKLTPKADDLWFKAMSIKKNTLSIQSPYVGSEPIPIFGSQKNSLKKENIIEDKNRVQWQTVADYYGLHDEIRY